MDLHYIDVKGRIGKGHQANHLLLSIQKNVSNVFLKEELNQKLYSQEKEAEQFL